MQTHSELQNQLLDFSIIRWLRHHGTRTKPNLTPEQQVELARCFRLLDEDGSGTLESDELARALEMMGIPARQKDIKRALKATNPEGTGEFDFEEFTLLMAGDEPEEDLPTERRRAKQLVSGLPFEMLAAAYRRKRLIGDILVEKRDKKKLESIMRNMAADSAAAATAAASPGEGARTSPKRPGRRGAGPASVGLAPNKSAPLLHAGLGIKDYIAGGRRNQASTSALDKYADVVGTEAERFASHNLEALAKQAPLRRNLLPPDWSSRLARAEGPHALRALHADPSHNLLPPIEPPSRSRSPFTAPSAGGKFRQSSPVASQIRARVQALGLIRTPSAP
eukprot:tig00001265_g7903.t1